MLPMLKSHLTHCQQTAVGSGSRYQILSHVFRFACDSRMSVCFLTRATCKKVWHESYQGSRCCCLTTKLWKFSPISLNKLMEFYLLVCWRSRNWGQWSNYSNSQTQVGGGRRRGTRVAITGHYYGPCRSKEKMPSILLVPGPSNS